MSVEPAVLEVVELRRLEGVLVSLLSSETAASQGEVRAGEAVVLFSSIQGFDAGHVRHAEGMEASVGQAGTIVAGAALGRSEEDHRAVLLALRHGGMLAAQPLLEGGLVAHDRALVSGDGEAGCLHRIPFIF